MTPELAIGAALLAGFFGSTHCVGMCGAIVVLFEGPASAVPKFNRWLRRFMYNVGRLLFYVLLGGVAGAGGAVLTKTVGISQGLLILRLLAAALVIAIGLNLLFDWRLTRFLESAGARLWPKFSKLAKHVLPVNSPTRALSAGFVWGALPCGLVYSAVAIAATSGNVLGGASIMIAFWLGTLPALLAVGVSAQQLNRWKSSKALRRMAGIVVILIGLAALTPFGATSGQHSHHAAKHSNTLQEST
ncbi:MAG: sulfite exporter TauE/SafE family protein [Woeseiaceae bacterium]